MISTGRQGGIPASAPKMGNALKRCGRAEPTVSAPTSNPMQSPRSSRHQVAINFIPGGYTPASVNPGRNRRKMAGATAATNKAMAALKRAPRAALPATSQRGGIRSARLSTALVRAPATKPSCTLMVSQAPAPPLRAHSASSCGSTAEAENQRAMARTLTAASNHRLRHLSRGSAGPRAAEVSAAPMLNPNGPRSPRPAAPGACRRSGIPDPSHP